MKIQPAGAKPAEAPARPETVAPLRLPDDFPHGRKGEVIRAGWEIFDDTPAALSAGAEHAGTTYDGNALSCRNCHLDHGARPGALPLTDFNTDRRYSPRKGLVITGEERINACLQRSLNASPLPAGSAELASLAAYLKWVADQGFAFTQEGPGVRDFPDRRADFVTGETLFYNICAFCHGGEVTGEAPPLWGPGSYGFGSDMNRLLVLAPFLAANMPPGEPELSLEEAYDVAAFVNSRKRPHARGLDSDYPALTKKPVDVPYPPYPDFFTQEQHQFGPFGPIIEYRERQRQADRWVYWVDHYRSGERDVRSAFEME